MGTNIIIQDWGHIDYNEALAKQRQLTENVFKSKAQGYLIFCTHPPVVTLGRKTQMQDVTSWTGPTVEVSRGGRATYHGPSQLLIYPIINLEKTPLSNPKRDVIWFMRTLEQALVNVLNAYGIAAHGKTQIQQKPPESLEDTGVWCGKLKLASVGIGVTNWISYHGMAINLDHDPDAFQGLLPCGYQPTVMTSLESLIGNPVDRDIFKNQIGEEIIRLLS